MKLHTLLSTLHEAPIVDYGLKGDQDVPRVFARPETIQMAKSPKARMKAERVFRNTPWNIRVFFWNEPSRKYTTMDRERPDLPVLPDGETKQKTMLGDVTSVYSDMVAEGAITFLITSDDGSNYVPFTPWMIAHRMGHTIIAGIPRITSMEQGFARMLTIVPVNQQIGGDLQNISGMMAYTRLTLMSYLGKFKSARDKNITHEGEFLMECFAQFLIQGRVSFNKITETYLTGSNIGGGRLGLEFTPEQIREVNSHAMIYERFLNENFRTIMNQNVGRVVAI